MSFGNTKSPLKPTDESKIRYRVPTKPNEKQPSKSEFYLTEELEQILRRLYPVTFNSKLMEWFGISFSTLHRFARELGLVKDMKIIKHKQAMLIKRKCEKNGYYDSLRGRPPSQNAIEATKRKRAEGFVPLKQLKQTSPRRYAALMRKRSRDRKALLEREGRRYRLSLMPESDLPERLYAGVQYTRYEIHVRHYARKYGYVSGDPAPESGERMCIYYNDTTSRLMKFERSATRKGFDFRPLSSRGIIR